MAPVDRSELVSDWVGALAQVVYIARSREEIERELTRALDELVRARREEPFSAERGGPIAKRFVELALTNPEAVEQSIDVLGRGVPQLLDSTASADRVARLIGAVTRGFS